MDDNELEAWLADYLKRHPEKCVACPASAGASQIPTKSNSPITM
jgi:hypothetical protein